MTIIKKLSISITNDKMTAGVTIFIVKINKRKLWAARRVRLNQIIISMGSIDPLSTNLAFKNEKYTKKPGF